MKTLSLTFALLLSVLVQGQSLKPGFDPAEYLELMLVSVVSVKDSAYRALHSPPKRFTKVYQSGSMALDNSWDLWTDADGVAAVSLRGTTAEPESWLENFYAAMLPAKGQLVLDTKGTTFDYELAPDPAAGVHAGWLVATAFLSGEIVPRLDSLYRKGTRDVLIVGHSQGGGIAYLLTAHLLHLQQRGKLPADLRIKTYCSAAPKPGNLPFASHYEVLTQNGWAYNVVNPNDWVPLVPMSIQTLDDFMPTNPFTNAGEAISKQSFKNRIMLNHVYRKLDKPTRKAQQNYEKYLGEMTFKMVSKQLEGLQVPPYLSSNHYVRTGNTISLNTTEAYFSRFPLESEKVFEHHIHESYMMAVSLTHFENEEADNPELLSVLRLHDIWALEHLEGSTADLAGSETRRPYMELDPREGRVSGFGGCNQFQGQIDAETRHITFKQLGASRMYCGDDNVEPAFMRALSGTFRWEFRDMRLYLSQNDEVKLVFRKVD